MATPLEIVIRAVDRFSPVFAELERLLSRSDGAGQSAGTALDAVGASLGKLAQTSAQAGDALDGFAAGAEQRLGALDDRRRAALDAWGAYREASAQALADRLLALDDDATARREAAREDAFAREQAATAAHHAALLSAESRFGHALQGLDTAVAQARLETFQRLAQSLESLAQTHGGNLARAARALAVAEALISAYVAGNKALASVPFPFNLAAAAAVTAQGLATVERIRQVGIAHGGLEQVPQDATYLLQRGERVLSAPQNRELTRFLEAQPQPEGGDAGRVVIEHLTVHVLENATQADALLAMSEADLRQVVTERVIPALDELARLGIRPRFVTDNT